MRERRETVEHPFGTLKMRMGATHFLMKRLPKVATEMALHLLAYNIMRVMNIMGVEPLIAAMRAGRHNAVVGACWSEIFDTPALERRGVRSLIGQLGILRLIIGRQGSMKPGVIPPAREPGRAGVSWILRTHCGPADF
jgi:transposase